LSITPSLKPQKYQIGLSDETDATAPIQLLRNKQGVKNTLLLDLYQLINKNTLKTFRLFAKRPKKL
jgi:hypothetical protein